MTGLHAVRTLVAGGAPAGARDQILAFLDVHPDALERSCRPGHLTASAFVVDVHRRCALLLHHRKLRRWLQPGGHADGDPDLARVALREATEETGIGGLVLARPDPVDLDVHEIAARPAEPRHLHLDVRFLVLAPPGSVPRGNDESTGLRWVPFGELDRHEEPGMRRLAAAGRTIAG